MGIRSVECEGSQSPEHQKRSDGARCGTRARVVSVVYAFFNTICCAPPPQAEKIERDDGVVFFEGVDWASKRLQSESSSGEESLGAARVTRLTTP